MAKSNDTKASNPSASPTDKTSKGGSDDLTMEDFFDREEMEMSMMNKGKKNVTNRAMPYRSVAESLQRQVSMLGSKIDGFRLSMGIPVNHRFMIGHRWNLVNPQANKGMNPMQMMQQGKGGSTYTFITQFVTKGMMTKARNGYACNGTIDNNGKMEAVINTNIFPWLSCVFQGAYMTRMPPQFMLMFDSDLGRSRHGLTLGNSQYGYNYVQSVGNNAQLGFSLTYPIQARTTSLGLAGRYLWGSKTFSASYEAINSSLSFGMANKLDRRTQIITMFEREKDMMSQMMGFGDAVTTKATLGYRRRFKKCSVKGMINSKGIMKTLINLGGMNDPIKLNLYGEGSLLKESFKFGFGIKIGSDM